MSFTNCLVVMAGGAIGTVARYLVPVIALPISGELPRGTIIIINVTGSLLIGFLEPLTLASGRFPVSEPMRLFVMIGICGGYTTFSSFGLQTLDLIRTGGMALATLNIGLSVALCIGAVAIGHLMAARLNSGATQTLQLNVEEEPQAIVRTTLLSAKNLEHAAQRYLIEAGCPVFPWLVQAEGHPWPQCRRRPHPSVPDACRRSPSS